VLLFRASLERDARAEVARGDREPLTLEGVRFDGTARFQPNSRLTYDARENLHAEQGTVSFWWRPDEPPGRLGFSLLSISYEQHSTWDYNFAGIIWTGKELVARIRDLNLRYVNARAQGWQAQAGRWTHLAMAWSEADGVALYVDGRLADRAQRTLHLKARLDQIGLLCRAMSPHQVAGSENRAALRDLRVYSAPLSADDVDRISRGEQPREMKSSPLDFALRHGWDEHANVPAGIALRFEKIPVVDARDVRKFSFKGADGKRETVWPVAGLGYLEEGRKYDLRMAPTATNLIRTTGDLDARIRWESGSYQRPGKRELHYHRLAHPAALDRLTIERQSGVLGDIELLRVEERRPREKGDGWTIGSGRVTVPVERETALDGVRVRLNAQSGRYYFVAVKDPANEARKLMEVDVQARSDHLDLTLDFPDLVAPAGAKLHVVIESSATGSVSAQARLLTANPVQARRQHVAERILQIRDSFQMLSESRPWRLLGPNYDVGTMRRQSKLADELYVLMEDVRRLDPANEVVRTYWGWVNRDEPPPAFREPPPPAGVPLWAHRQIQLLRVFGEVADWWIDNRQIESGEMGGGLGDDTDMIQNWPALALLDGPREKLRLSARRVLEACYRQGLIAGGLNAHRMDALHAYEEGLNALAPVFQLEYGNPVILERMMEVAAHYRRLTGRNAAGHRHFRSFQFSATDIVEEGYHAREDEYSHFILHPGMYLIWYNGSPEVRKLVRELADSLLDHWRESRYPDLAQGVLFATDQVLSRSAPRPAIFSLFWGLYESTGDPRTLWLQKEAVRGGDAERAAAAGGRWWEPFDPRELAPVLSQAIARQDIMGRNLNVPADQQVLAVRAVDWQVSGDSKVFEEGQAALLRHMVQNRMMYTQAEQYTDRILIPTLPVQVERLGGSAHVRNQFWPGHAVSWEGTNGAFAAQVIEARPDSLRVRMFNTAASPRRVTARVWRLENGLYELTLEEEGGKALWSRAMRLKRAAAVEIEAVPKKSLVLSIRQLERGRALTDLPDLALAAEEIQSGQPLIVPVHNIGSTPAGRFVVRVFDRDGKRLAEAWRPGLDAPADLRPRVDKVEFAELRPKPGMRITAALEAGSEEICDGNNEVILR